MQDFLKVTGMVINAVPHGEMDKRLTILTKECGKISVFVKGARRQGNRFQAVSDLFVFAEFDLFVGRSSYNLQDVKVLNYFECFRDDLNAAYYGMYFLELSDYYALENNDEALLLLLLYRALQGLKSLNLSNDFVRSVFECKLFMIEGEFIPIDKIKDYAPAVVTAINYIEASSIEKLFSFSLDTDAFLAFREIADYERKHLIDKKMKSLDILETMIS